MFIKLKEFTKEELKEQLDNKDIDIDFLLSYTEERDKGYNQLIVEVNSLYERIKVALEVLEERQSIYSNEKRLKQLEETISIECVIEILRGNY